MMLVSVTITNRRDSVVVDALRSVVGYVDKCLVLSSHGSEYDFAVERETVGDILATGAVAPIVTPDDMARARNDGLEAARALGADWVLILDTDERMHWREIDPRPKLAETTAESFVIQAEEGFYFKDKFLRPGTGHYEAVAHEAWVPDNPMLRAKWAPGPRFSELPKTPEQLRARDLAVIESLLADLAKNPDNARSYFYLGESYSATGQPELAKQNYEKCLEFTGWGEEAGWSNFKLATIYFGENQLDMAVKCCAMALACNPSLAEAAYLCSVIRATQQRGQDAMAWASMAAANGCFSGIGKELYRIHFRDVIGLWEGPYEVLRAVFFAIDQPERSAECCRQWRLAYHARLEEDGGPHVLPDDWRLTQDLPPSAPTDEPVPDTLRGCDAANGAV